MTQDEIVKLAREAGYGEAMSDLHAPALERFANLVAAAEREACAKLFEDDGMLWGARCAEKIRTRGEK